MIKYVFRDDEPIRIKAAGKADPQVIGEALEEITKSCGGELTPKAVVDAARSDNHPLHPHFEWNDTLAAESWRIEQARNVVRIVRVEDVASEDGTARAFLSIASKDGVAYRAIAEVKASAELQESLLRQADRDLEAFQRRYRALKEICEHIVTARKAIERKLSKSESRAAA